ncbi:glycoside hydrolase family 43 protein, partial [Tulasnella calospora MUT 4182]
YCLGLLKYMGGDPLHKANWQKSGPHFSSANRNYGPGHNSFVTTPGGWALRFFKFSCHYF